jgi:hypothetical protein
MAEVTNTVDSLAEAYIRVRDATFCNQDISNAEKIAVLEQVKHEILTNTQSRISAG